MKMKFIPLLFVLGLMSANAQITTTTGAKVFVSSGTLVYSTKDVTVNTGTEKFQNNGNLKIAEGTLKGTADYNAFVLGYTAEDDYGQMIIASGESATGRMSINWLNPTTGAYTTNPDGTIGSNRNIYFGTPFVDYEYQQFAKDVTGDTNEPDLETPCGFERCFNSGPYGRHAIFEWNNDKFRFDPVDKNSEDGKRTFIPGKFYTIRKDRFKNKTAFTGTTGVTRFYNGTPYVAKAGAPTIAFPELNITIGNNALNLYKVSYSTYLSDPFISVAQLPVYNKYTTDADLKDVGYANRLLQLINPYTSNIDIKAVTNGFQNIQGVGSFGITTKSGTAIERYAGKSQTASVSGGNLVGDNLRFIPPMTNFFIKASTSGVSINLLGTPASTAEADQIQTFEKTTYKAGNATDTPTAPTTRMATRSTSTESPIYQLKLNLLSADKNSIYNYTYVAASSNFATGENTEVEVGENDIASTEIGVYTLPEAKTGGLDPNISTESRLRINVLNTESAKVAIPVAVNVPSSAEATSFVFTANLTENQKSVPTNFDDPNAKFYFHDKGEDGNQNIVMEINADFAYPVTISQSTNDRFEIFWKEASTLGNEDIQTLESLTTVYKTGSDYKVKFDTNWKKADVSVFNILGQLISSEKNISTQNDYLLPIYNASSTMYIIKIVNEKGEVVTKKIVK